jgi:hypothetical protein
MQPNFGVTYVSPVWRQGIGADSGVCAQNAYVIYHSMSLVNLGESPQISRY